jgi:aldehyde dehydrogenase (NAD+)
MSVVSMHTTALGMFLVHELCMYLIIINCRLPPGVISVLPGGSEVGWRLISHSGVSKLMFSGSTGVGRLMRKQTAGLGMHLTLCK